VYQKNIGSTESGEDVAAIGVSTTSTVGSTMLRLAPAITGEWHEDAVCVTVSKDSAFHQLKNGQRFDLQRGEIRDWLILSLIDLWACDGGFL